jgi:hypothetical protein
MLNRFFGLNFDFAGVITASLCAVHCTLVPIFLSLGLTTNTSHDHTFDFVMMSIGVLIAGYSLVKDYIKSHKNPMPLFLALVGFVTLFIGIETHGDLFILNILGGLLIVVSHLVNWKLSHTNIPVQS